MIINQTSLQNIPALLTTHQTRIRVVVLVLLSICLIAYAADMTWKLIPTPSSNAPAASTPRYTGSVASSQRGVDIGQIQQLNLFGEVNKSAPPPVQETITDAPETRLNLVLSGLVASTDEEAGTAVIENRGKQATYAIGDKIDGTNAILSQVHIDRVIIKNGGQHETLMLAGLDFSKQNAANNAARNRQPARAGAQPARRARELSEDAVAATEALREKPASFTDFISVTPALENGQMIGYRVKPGKDASLFESVGLINDDVVIQINGLDLTDPAQARDAMGELRDAQSIELTVTRDGEYITLYLDMPEQ